MWVSALCCCVNEDVFSCGYGTPHSPFLVSEHEVYKLWSVVGELRGVCGVRACQRASAAPGPPPPPPGLLFHKISCSRRRPSALPRQHTPRPHPHDHTARLQPARSSVDDGDEQWPSPAPRAHHARRLSRNHTLVRRHGLRTPWPSRCHRTRFGHIATRRDASSDSLARPTSWSLPSNQRLQPAQLGIATPRVATPRAATMRTGHAGSSCASTSAG